MHLQYNINHGESDMTTTAIVTMTDIKGSFEAIEKLSKAASELRKQTNEGKIKAYCLIIAHLENIKAGKQKKDKKAAETYDELLKLNIKKSIARRYIENSQAWRRHGQTASSGIPDENLAEMDAYDIHTESALKQFLFPTEKKWYESAVKFMVKSYMEAITKSGEIKAQELIKELGSEWDAAYRAELAKAERKAGPIIVATQEPDKKPQSPKKPPATPKSGAKR